MNLAPKPFVVCARSVRTKVLALSIGLCFVLAVSARAHTIAAQAQTWYVSPDGNDANDGADIPGLGLSCDGVGAGGNGQHETQADR